MSDSRLRGRVKGLFAGASPESELMEQAPPPMHSSHALSDADSERQALQVLVLARRTADEHVASALAEADRIRADALAKANGMAKDAAIAADNVRREAAIALTDARGKVDEMAKEAAANAEVVRREAEKSLADARARAEQIAKEAAAAADGVRREADKALTDARAQAAEIGKDAKAMADALEREAQERYQEVVGSLENKRSGLQQKIEALQQFDRDYRARLKTFMHSQLRALVVDEPPPLNEEIDQQDAVVTTGYIPAQE
jgi:cell division septum initiation protein DivIVA